jgi:hypothetical protein
MEIEPLLVADKEGKFEAKTLCAELCRKRPGVFEPGQLRTLQRRVREGCAERGPDEERFHQGREARFAEERAALKPLPSSRLPESTRVLVEVRKWSTLPVAGHIDSVPSRLNREPWP